MSHGTLGYTSYATPRPTGLDPEPSILDTEPSILDTVLSILDTEPSILDTEPSNLHLDTACSARRRGSHRDAQRAGGQQAQRQAEERDDEVTHPKLSKLNLQASTLKIEKPECQNSAF